MTNELRLTDLEKEFIRTLHQDYLSCGINNCDYYNVFGYGNRRYRGALSSLIKKGVVEWVGMLKEYKDCFNPIYPSKNYKVVAEQLGLVLNEEIKLYL